MERTEPTLIPEWLKNSTNTTGVTSPSYADDHSAPSVSKSTSNGHNSGWHGSERASNSYTRWNSGAVSSGKFRSYSSSGRNQHDRQGERGRNGYRDKEKSEDRWRMKLSEPDGDSSFSRFGRDGRRSQSMVPGNRGGDSWTRKAVADLASAGGKSSDGALAKARLSSGANKAMFERDFPSLKVDDKSILPDVGRVPSPGLTPAIQSLPISPSASLGEKWTSALAEVPMIVGSNGSVLSSTSNVSSASSTSVGLSATTGLNMAEAVTHGPIRAATAPQLSDEAQRREELAIKQSRQLIPVTPVMPKALALNSSDKQKIKVQLPSSVNHASRGLPGKVDSSKAANPAKFHVLKSAREKNGLSLTSGMNSSSPTRLRNSVFAPLSSSAAVSNGINNGNRKPASTVSDKRPSFQAQSRNEFFKLVRKKSMENNSSSFPENRDNVISPSTSEKHPDTWTVDAAPRSSVGQELDTPKQKAEDACTGQEPATNGETHPPSDPAVSEEEEAAFLKSLGWEENDEEGGALTEEEISAFRMNLTKYIESNPSLRILQGTELRFLLPFDSSSRKATAPNGIPSSDGKATKLES